VNLLVTSVEESALFATRVLSAETVYADVDFAVMRASGTEWMLHADHTYDNHPMAGVVDDIPARGCGIELRLHHCDPDQACAAARTTGWVYLGAGLTSLDRKFFYCEAVNHPAEKIHPHSTHRQHCYIQQSIPQAGNTQHEITAPEDHVAQSPMVQAHQLRSLLTRDCDYCLP